MLEFNHIINAYKYIATKNTIYSAVQPSSHGVKWINKSLIAASELIH